MNKQDLLKQIADTAYNVGFGAKKHFATFDIVDKAPGWIGFISMAIGVLALFIEVLSKKEMSSFLIILGVIGLYINFYNETKNQYADKGSELTKLFNELKTLYFNVKSSTSSDLDDEQNAHLAIESRYYSNCLHKQIFLSDWYAHYKFFWQHQIDWIDEQKQFKFWRDKVPLSFLFVVIVILVLIIGSCVCPIFKGLIK
jgi:hypothetical protein